MYRLELGIRKQLEYIYRSAGDWLFARKFSRICFIRRAIHLRLAAGRANIYFASVRVENVTVRTECVGAHSPTPFVRRFCNVVTWEFGHAFLFPVDRPFRTPYYVVIQTVAVSFFPFFSFCAMPDIRKTSQRWERASTLNEKKFEVTIRLWFCRTNWYFHRCNCFIADISDVFFLYFSSSTWFSFTKIRVNVHSCKGRIIFLHPHGSWILLNSVNFHFHGSLKLHF